MSRDCPFWHRDNIVSWAQKANFCLNIWNFRFFFLSLPTNKQMLNPKNADAYGLRKKYKKDIRTYWHKVWLGTGTCHTDDDIKGKIAEISGLQLPTEVQNLAKSERNTILKQLCEYGANIRQISRVTGISYGVIYRAKSGSWEPSPFFYEILKTQIDRVEEETKRNIHNRN